MKIRRDFVTNSSSSSFIFAHSNDNMTKDIILHIVQEFYKDFLKIFNEIKDNADEYGLKYNLEYGVLEEKNEDELLDKYELLESFGIHPWDSDNKDTGWLDLETYEDFEKYFEEKKKFHVFAPFTILDLKEEPKIRYDELLGVVAEDDYSDILMWYISCADDLLYDLPYEENVENYLEWRLNQLDNISEKDLEDEWHKCNCCAFKYNDCNCKKFRNGVKSREITIKNASFIMLGRFCISSFEGDIPYTVVQKLEEITAYKCNHMG